ncbi:pyridoxamine 5'-phosphate oxidase family protein [uncultured Maribacter sp.]|uniref:pyridoxamine 5'-phosphate oxidase family protein n=1 Tax=uncultured Maribacter sp. TaxID=431308 RepID=UPI0030EBEC46|tara:strand:+ start:3768 stop:4256 length:489 start_codon:yes stop_codon:yes gene_type:complete
MDIIENWQLIKNHFNLSFKTSLSVSIASVDKDNKPTVTPIGTVFLNKDQTGFYFEKFPKKIPQNAKANKNICVLAVNSSKWFWIKALYKLKFETYPAIRLYGELGEKRKASEIEISRLNRRMRTTKGLKGNTYLWGDMDFVREMKFTKAEGIHIGKMTKNLS